jgi:hypothetical protein
MRTPTPPSAPGERPLIDRLRASTAGRYEIHAELGVGGMATVFRATEIALERQVAIKVMSSAMATSPGAFERFRREARVAAALSHPHIVPIYAIGEDPALAWFAMKFIEGRGLDAILKKDGGQPVGNVVQTISVVGRALHHAHGHGVVHRDVKPANIMVGNDGWVYVTDFGIAKRDDSEGLTQAGTVIGTPAYMSPEQFNGQEITGAADQYALGVVAYEMLAGRTPFDAPSLGEVMRGHLLDPPPPLRTLRVDLPLAVAEAVNRMLAKEPADRFPSLGDAVTALEEAAKSAAARKSVAPYARTVVPMDPAMSPTTPIPRSNPSVTTSGAARRPVTATHARPSAPETGGSGIVRVLLGLVLLAGGGWYLWQGRGEQSVVATPPSGVVLDSAPPVGAALDLADTAVATSSDTTRREETAGGSLDSAIADLAARVAAAPVVDVDAPFDSVVVRVGSQTLQTVLFVNGQQLGIVGGRGLIEAIVPQGPVSLSVRRINCRDWDTTFTGLAGRRYTFVERSPTC